jgi:hypothetical protein
VTEEAFERHLAARRRVAEQVGGGAICEFERVAQFALKPHIASKLELSLI